MNSCSHFSLLASRFVFTFRFVQGAAFELDFLGNAVPSRHSNLNTNREGRTEKCERQVLGS